MAILYPQAFKRSLPAGFDGVFDWDFLRGCFPRGIMPMDFDGVVEINSRWLIFETKDVGKDIPAGQLQALRRLFKFQSFTLVFLWGKSSPEFWQWERPEISGIGPRPCTADLVCQFVSKWAWVANGQMSERYMDFTLLRVVYPKSGGQCPF
jgi:hypothetical protein